MQNDINDIMDYNEYYFIISRSNIYSNINSFKKKKWLTRPLFYIIIILSNEKKGEVKDEKSG